METIEVRGVDGSSILYDGSTVTKFRSNGMQEVMRNPASTFRQVDVTPRKPKRKGWLRRAAVDVEPEEQQYDVALAMAGIFMLVITENERPKLDQLVESLKSRG
jgi:hypothetical protein